MRELDSSVKLERDIYWALKVVKIQWRSCAVPRATCLIHIKDRKPANAFTFVPDEYAAHFTEAAQAPLIGNCSWERQDDWASRSSSWIRTGLTCRLIRASRSTGSYLSRLTL